MARTWSPIRSEIVTSLVASGCTFELPREQWPFGSTESQFVRIFVYGLTEQERIPSSVTTAEMVARLLTERFDAKDTLPLNYNWYSIVERSDRQFFQSGPHKDVDFGHHLASPASLASIGVTPSGGRTS